MNPPRQLTIGLGIVLGGLAALTIGVVVASHDLLVGLILLLLVPLSLTSCGAIVALIGLVRQPEAQSRSDVIRRIVGGAALACLGSGFGYGALATLSQLPDWVSGDNGPYLPEDGLSLLLFAATCLLVGLGSGAGIALGWWMIRGRHVKPAAVAQGAR
jgi:hypothetical protein